MQAKGDRRTRPAVAHLPHDVSSIYYQESAVWLPRTLMPPKWLPRYRIHCLDHVGLRSLGDTNLNSELSQATASEHHLGNGYN